MNSTIPQNLQDVYVACIDLHKTFNIRRIEKSDIVFEGEVGSGGQAKVAKGKLDGIYPVAVKTLTDIDYNRITHEIYIISNLKHPNIPTFYGLILDDATLTIHLVFELINGVSISDIFYQKLYSTLSEDSKLHLAKQLAGVLEYVHSQGMVHRDLNPSNILFDRNCKLYLIDFGVGKVFLDGDTIITRSFGVIRYVPPEVYFECEDRKSLSIVTSKYDVWSYGCILALLFTGVPPWMNLSDSNIGKKLSLQESFEYERKLVKSDIIKQIIENSTICDKDKRCDMSQIVQVFEKYTS